MSPPNVTHHLANRAYGGKPWTVCERCRVAWPITWGYAWLTPCEASAWGR